MPIGLGIGLGTTSGGRVFTIANDGLADTNALNARFSTPMTAPRKALYQALFASLRTGATSGSDIIAKMDALYILAANDTQAAQRNIIQDLYNLTEVGTVTFTQDRGYQGDGATGYLETGADISALSKYTLNSAHGMVWMRTDTLSGTDQDMGTSGGNVFAINARHTSTGTIRGRINDGTFANFGSTSTAIGMSALNRSASNSREAYRNGAQIGTSSTASTSLLSQTLRLLFLGPANFDTRQEAVASFGGSLSVLEHADLYSAVNTYLIAVGAA